MIGDKRRDKIIADLEQTKTPISASTFAKEFSVSRQIIVGDIALLRAAGSAVRATSKGYILVTDNGSEGYLGKVVCQHRPEQTEAELSLIVKLGGSVLDVAIEHDYYGELVGNLDIQTEADVQSFMAVIEQKRVRLLSDLTGGIHIHTLRCRDDAHFLTIKQALSEHGLLYQESES